MRTLSAALITELGVTVKRPGYLVEIQYSTPLRLSTLGDISWDGQNWSAANVVVSGLAQDGKGFSTANLAVGNTDGAMGALVLNEGANDIVVRIWVVYAGATASGDPVQVFQGVTNGADIALDKVAFALVAQNRETLESPRVFIGQLAGFHHLKPAGSVMTVGAEVFVLPPGSYSKGNG